MPSASPKSETRSARRGAAGKRAAVAVFAGLTAFAALQLGTAVVTERWLPGVIDPDYGNRLRRVLPQPGEARPPTLVVMLGSSHVQCGLNEAALEECLSEELGRPVRVGNFGVAGGGPVTELVAWRRLRRDGVRPDLLLVEVMPEWVSRDQEAGEMSEVRMPTSRLRWRDLPVLERYQAGSRPHLWRDAALAEVNALYARRVGILNTLAPDLLPMPAGVRPVVTPDYTIRRYDPPPEVRRKALELLRRSPLGRLPCLDPGEDGSRPLRELLQSCREARVPVALVLMPAGPTYRGVYAPGTGPAVLGWLGALGREFEAPLINAREWIDDEDDYYDSHHLLPQGAGKFVERLGREYLAPWLRPPRAGGDRAPPSPS